MVNPRARGAGEGKGNDDKGKGKMVSPSDTSKDIPLLLKKYELLEESHWKTLLEIDAASNISIFFNRSGISLEVPDGDTIFPLPLSSLPLPSPAPPTLGLTILLGRNFSILTNAS
nr:hypothetical protein Iba_chr08bCG6550 [Ipomoea batatas]GMD25018.1 hypothetical protein Iba_chr08cCG6120 [Ipomoea batatas]